MSPLGSPELIGVMAPYYRHVKRHLLLFDRIAYPWLEHFVPRLKTEHRVPDFQAIAELEWLQDRGLVFDPLKQFADSFPMPPGAAPLLNRMGSKMSEMHCAFGLSERSVLVDQLSEIQVLFSRGFAVLVRHQLQTNAVSVCGLESFNTPPDGLDASVPQNPTETRLTEVAAVVVEALPVPAEGVPLERLVEFRTDERVSGFHRNLRVWINRSAMSELSPRDLAGEIEAAVGDYQRCMRQFRIEHRMGSLEVLIALMGAIGASKLGGAAPVLATVGSVAVSLCKKRAALTRAEATARGVELAYISKARETFGP